MRSPHHFSFHASNSSMPFWTLLVLFYCRNIFCAPKDLEKGLSPFSWSKCLKYTLRFNLRKNSWGRTLSWCRLCMRCAVIRNMTQKECFLRNTKVKWQILMGFVLVFFFVVPWRRNVFAYIAEISKFANKHLNLQLLKSSQCMLSQYQIFMSARLDRGLIEQACLLILDPQWRDSLV